MPETIVRTHTWKETVNKGELQCRVCGHVVNSFAMGQARDWGGIGKVVPACPPDADRNGFKWSYEELNQRLAGQLEDLPGWDTVGQRVLYDNREWEIVRVDHSWTLKPIEGNDLPVELPLPLFLRHCTSARKK